MHTHKHTLQQQRNGLTVSPLAVVCGPIRELMMAFRGYTILTWHTDIVGKAVDTWSNGSIPVPTTGKVHPIGVAPCTTPLLPPVFPITQIPRSILGPNVFGILAFAIHGLHLMAVVVVVVVVVAAVGAKGIPPYTHGTVLAPLTLQHDTVGVPLYTVAVTPIILPITLVSIQ